MGGKWLYYHKVFSKSFLQSLELKPSLHICVILSRPADNRNPSWILRMNYFAEFLYIISLQATQYNIFHEFHFFRLHVFPLSNFPVFYDARFSSLFRFLTGIYIENLEHTHAYICKFTFPVVPLLPLTRHSHFILSVFAVCIYALSLAHLVTCKLPGPPHDTRPPVR